MANHIAADLENDPFKFSPDGGLSQEEATIEHLLTFLDPECIHEKMLLDGAKAVQGDEFNFLREKYGFEDTLLSFKVETDLIKSYSPQTGLITLRNLEHEAIIHQLSPKERIHCADIVITILSHAFPNTLNVCTGSQYEAWPQYAIVLPHVRFLIRRCNRLGIKPTNPKAYAELIFRMAWFLYETEQYNSARELTEMGLSLLHEREYELTLASGLMILGLLCLDIGDLYEAKGHFLMALERRKLHLSADDELNASSLNALSLAYTELDEFEDALECSREAIEIRLKIGGAMAGNSWSNRAALKLKMGEVELAEDVLLQSADIRVMIREGDAFETKNPRVTGDMMLLAKIKQQQGKYQEALKWAEKALEQRKKILGDSLKKLSESTVTRKLLSEKSLKICDSYYQVAVLQSITGNPLHAIDNLEASRNLADEFPDYGAPCAARANYMLYLVYQSLHQYDDAQTALKNAERLRPDLQCEDVVKPHSRELYESFVNFMLW